MYLNKFFHSCVFFSIQVLSTVEESVRQSLFMTSHQSQTKCGGNEVCVTFEIHCTEKKSVVLENPLKKCCYDPASPVYILYYNKIMYNSSLKINF